MFTEYQVLLQNDHLLINDSQRLLIDTGSPTSFHKTGRIELCGKSYNVAKSLMSVTSDYLTKEVGCDLHGIIGMDIMSMQPILFDLRNKFIYIDDDAIYSTKFPSFILPYDMICVELMVNGCSVRLIVDTGAKISYIDSEIVDGLNSVDTKEDFSPQFGHFSTKIYECTVQYLEGKSISLKFGTPPHLLSTFLSLLHVQGILGLDFFKRFRLQLKGGELFFPPQGI